MWYWIGIFDGQNGTIFYHIITYVSLISRRQSED